MHGTGCVENLGHRYRSGQRQEGVRLFKCPAAGAREGAQRARTDVREREDHFREQEPDRRGREGDVFVPGARGGQIQPQPHRQRDLLGRGDGQARGEARRGDEGQDAQGARPLRGRVLRVLRAEGRDGRGRRPGARRIRDRPGEGDGRLHRGGERQEGVRLFKRPAAGAREGAQRARADVREREDHFR